MVGLWEDGTPIGRPYHQCPYEYKNGTPKMQPWYDLTHIASGTSIGSDEDVEDEAVARRWLDPVAPLIEWTQPAETFRGQASFLRPQLESPSDQAQYQRPPHQSP